jgi:hypothetical protein
MSTTIPPPKLYLPLTHASTNTSLGLTSSVTAPSNDPDNGLTFDDIYRNDCGTQKFITVPLSSGPSPLIQQSKSMTVCFCLNLNNYLPNNSLYILCQGNKSVIGREANAESLILCYNRNKQLYLTLRIGNNVTPNNGHTLQTSSNVLQPNTWNFIAYTITASSNELRVSLYVGNNASSTITTARSNAAGGQDNITYNINYRKSGSSVDLPNMFYNQVQLGDRFHNPTNLNNTGYGLNGYIRDFMVFDRALSPAQLTTMAKTLPIAGSPFPAIVRPSSYPAIIRMPTVNPKFPFISGLQTLINYFPPPNVLLPLSIAPTPPTAIVNPGTTITFNSTKGATFPNNPSPTLDGVTTNNYINIPTKYNLNNLTISFSLYLNYINTKSLRILTLGNVSGSTSTEVLSINTDYIRRTGEQGMATTNCSSKPRSYSVSTTVNRTAANQNTIINQSKPFLISSVNGFNKGGQVIDNKLEPKPTNFTNSGLSQFPATTVVTIEGDNSDIFVNSDKYIGNNIYGPFIGRPSTIVSITRLGSKSDSSSGQPLYSFEISNPFTGIPSSTVGNMFQYEIGSKPSGIPPVSSVNGYNKTGQVQENKLVPKPPNFTNSGLLQFPATTVVTITGDKSDIFVNPSKYIGRSISGPFIGISSTIVSITPLGSKSESSSGQPLFSFEISNPFTGIPPVTVGNIFQYEIDAKSEPLPTDLTSSVKSGSMTTVYNGQQFSVSECVLTLVTLVLNNTDITMYINNNVCRSIPIPAGFTYNTIRIGDTFNNNSLCFVGSLKNFIIYNNALTSGNVKYFYDRYILNTPSSPSVTLHFAQDDLPSLEYTNDTFASYYDQNDIPFLEDTTETFVNIQPSNKFVKFARLYSIAGILFYIVLLITDKNYDGIITNKSVSFALNVLLIICSIVSIRN